MTAADSRRDRRVFGRRRGKPLSATRKALVEETLGNVAIDIPDGESDIDPGTWFDASIESIWLEVGFGKGEHLAWQAQQNPHVGIIGCEPYETGTASLLAELSARNIGNVRVFSDDAAYLLSSLKPACLKRTFILFPDPWPKKRHHKRRFINETSLGLLADALDDGAELRIATDHPGYLQWILKAMLARPEFEWLVEGPADWRTRTADWPQTRYEAKALEAGARPAYLRYRRAPRAGHIA